VIVSCIIISVVAICEVFSVQEQYSLDYATHIPVLFLIKTRGLACKIRCIICANYTQFLSFFGDFLGFCGVFER
jgi:hypothetical protein